MIKPCLTSNACSDPVGSDQQLLPSQPMHIGTVNIVLILVMLRSLICTSLRVPTRGALGYRATRAVQHQSSTAAEETMPDKFQSEFLETMKNRGFIHQCTNFRALDERMKQTTVAYLGFDATARSLHVGSLMQIMILRNLQRAGHKPIVLIGGGTTKVGDPSGKDESRQMMSEETIQENITALSRVFGKFLKFGDGPTDAVMVNNAQWLDQINYLDFLRDYGCHFTVNRMLSMDSVKNRLAREQPLTFLEFNYMLLQSYDFVELHKRHRASLQLGGSDQWGNIVSGVELGRRMRRGPLYGLTSPLVTTADGRKMGKTAAGAVWLDKELLSEFDYWQFWRNTADADVIRFLKLFTDLPLEQIASYEALTGADLNAVKVVLADEATRLLHGEACLVGIHHTVRALFAAQSAATAATSDLGSLEQVTLSANELTSKTGSPAVCSVSVVDLLVKTGFAASKNAARRLIAQGGAKINDLKVDDEAAVVTEKDFDANGRLKLSGSKKKHVVVVLP